MRKGDVRAAVERRKTYRHWHVLCAPLANDKLKTTLYREFLELDNPTGVVQAYF